MKKFLIALVSIAALFNTTAAFSWGPTGHDVVAAIAEAHLTPKTHEALDKILGGHSIVYYSSWMDGIQNSPYWEAGYKQTKTWHYANVDKGETYQSMKKNEAGDVVVATERLVGELKNNYENLTDSMRADYVKMIVHMVGDMHCPMHAGRLSDLGGNRTKVRWFGRNTNLHSVWDSKIVESARNWSYSEWRDQLDRPNRGQEDEFYESVSGGTIEEWFVETVENAAVIYEYVEGKEENPNLSYQFVHDFSPMLENRLLVGGYRLAYVLNSIFDPEGVQPNE